MRRSRFTEEQILQIIRDGESGRKVEDLCRAYGIHKHTYYAWKKKFGGLQLDEAKRLRQLEEENRRLKHIVAEQALDIVALKAVVSKKW